MINNEIIKHLSNFVTEQRLEKFNEILLNRTNYVTVVLEDIFQSHNASAVLRTCDCFGVQNVFVIENRNEFKPNNEISLGASNWLTINSQLKNKDSKSVITHLKKSGYRIIATMPDSKAISINELNLEKGKIAFIFGTEKLGLSKEAISLADEYVKIPMYGFTESFNVSVSAAIILSNIIERLKKSKINWQLSDIEKDGTLLDWLKNSIKSSEEIIERYYNK
ncbi:MAG: TrmH family RNA methyltransferase [Bacteroidetes bacterium CG02_land_8_20_14_3_00_31_25]|nr:MAG: TrmH family RNA methyltransferase [Bacteroidetes bacterium CG02_land_8_20_14_3_00_31_25]PIX33773.1 MAG: TrmH family RNA methyltransferase [Bacteroidetes bacterium CG_4_8_14_3_um_filter_31_14]PIY04077.1 MAG: TrmH family RNA methyltransferase [Bacteroidetes bacterium CG_4_10_14_3_um_filter_31_20]